MEIESRRSEVIRHGCLRGDGVNPLIHLSQFDTSAYICQEKDSEDTSAVDQSSLLFSSCYTKLTSRSTKYK